MGPVRASPHLSRLATCEAPATTPHQAMMTLTSATERLTVLRRRLLPRDPLPHRLPLQAPEGQLHHPHLPPKHQLERQHLLGHSARSVEPSLDHQQRYANAFPPTHKTPRTRTEALRPCVFLTQAKLSLDADMLTFFSPAEHLLHADRPQPRRPARPRDRTCVQDGPVPVRVDGQGVDPKVCDLELALTDISRLTM